MPSRPNTQRKSFKRKHLNCGCIINKASKLKGEYPLFFCHNIFHILLYLCLCVILKARNKVMTASLQVFKK